RIERRRAAAERVLRPVMQVHAVFLDRDHAELPEHALCARYVRVLGCSQAPRALGKKEYPLLRPAMLTIERPIGETAVVSPRPEIHRGGLSRLIYKYQR